MKKVCAKCKVKKDTSDFYPEKRYKNAFQHCCKVCYLKRVIAYRSSKKGIEHYRKHRRTKRYKLRNNAYMKEYRKSEKYKQYTRYYRTTEKGRLIFYINNLKRRALKQSTDDKTINLESLKAIWVGYCKICKKKIDMNAKRGEKLHCHLDHIRPITRGGLHSIKNVQWLCGSCNIRKSNKI